MSVMKIIVLRHGMTEYNKRGVGNGQVMEDPLVPEGIEQVRSMLPLLPEHIDLLYVSDLLRTPQTAEIVNEKYHAPIIYDPRLREVDYGTLVGKSWGQMEMETGLPVLGNNLKVQYDYRPYGGESVLDIKTRVLAALETIKKDAAGKKVIVVTHGGVVRLLDFILLNKLTDRMIPNSVPFEYEI